MDEAGYIITNTWHCKDNVEGVFAAGMYRIKFYRQAVTAAEWPAWQPGCRKIFIRKSLH
jgi:thioredoxin reductase